MHSDVYSLFLFLSTIPFHRYATVCLSVRFFVCVCFFSLGPHLQHMEVPRLGSNQSCSCQPTPEPQQHQIWAMSVTHNTAHRNAGSLTQWARPGIEPATSWFPVGYVSTAPLRELLNSLLDRHLCCFQFGANMYKTAQYSWRNFCANMFSLLGSIWVIR